MDGWNTIWDLRDEIAFVVGGVGTVFAAGFTVGRLWEKRFARKLEEGTEQLQVEQLNDAMTAFLNQEGRIWEKKKGPFPEYQSWIQAVEIPILSVANLKGGVAKTTTSLNLAAHYERAGKRVLFVDLDWQGSASEVFRRKLELPAGVSPIDALFDPSATWERLLALREAGGQFAPKMDFIRAYKTLLDLENKAMMDWLSGKTPFDAHYLLAKALLNPNVLERYDIVILDTPPRLTTALVNALCASTHVLIPTILDETSVEAALHFQATCERYRRDNFNPRLRVAGVFGTKTEGINAEHDAEASYTSGAEQLHLPNKWLSAKIPRRSHFSDVAGKDIAVYARSQTRTFFKDLATELDREFAQ